MCLNLFQLLQKQLPELFHGQQTRHFNDVAIRLSAAIWQIFLQPTYPCHFPLDKPFLKFLIIVNKVTK